MPAAGQPAPDFEAPDQDGKPFRLSSLHGSPVVLYFYPQADTPGCTVESKGFRDYYRDFQGAKVQVIGVSVDDCPDQKAFQGKYSLPFPLISDSAKKVTQLYGVLGPSGRARRVTFLIESNGTIREVVDQRDAAAHVKRAKEVFVGR